VYSAHYLTLSENGFIVKSNPGSIKGYPNCQSILTAGRKPAIAPPHGTGQIKEGMATIKAAMPIVTIFL